MKISLTLIACLFIVCPTFAQKKLSQSRQSSKYSYIYKLTDKEAFEILAKPKTEMTSRFFHTVVDSFVIEKSYNKQLDFGHYLFVSVVKNDFNYRLKNVQNTDIQFINNLKEFQFSVVDLKGNLLQNADVEIAKGKKINFDAKAKLYKSSFPKKEEIITVRHNGVTNFFNYTLQDRNYNPRKSWSFFKKLIYSFPIKYTWQPIKRLFRKRYKQVKRQYAGYMVFSKPKYKPLDTVKLKAYILKNKGDLIKNIQANVELMIDGKAKLLGTIAPYKDGGYEYSFVLADSLNLKLDRSYNISITDKAKDISMLMQSFNYEDYELKSVNFSARTDRTEHKIGAPIALYLKATDENELAVPDGRVEIVALTSYVNKFYKNKVFVPDTLWKKSLKLDPVGETKLVLPDSIFPKADLRFNLNINFLNSNNESRRDSKNLSYKYSKDDLKEIKGSLKNDSLLIDYRLNDKSTKEKATVSWFTKGDVLLDSQVVTLPKIFKTDYRASYIEVKTAGGFRDDIDFSNFNPNLSIGAVQSKDSLRVLVNNENKIPFWYTIFSGDKIILKGYTKVLDTAFKHTANKAAHIRVNYFWDEKEKTEEVSAFYNPNILNVKLISPDVVYPGQKVNMLVKVTDVNNLPVANTDLTAYASTSKFKNNYTPSIPAFQKGFKVRKKDNIQIETDDSGINSRMDLNWLKWGKALGLDTIEYYKFTHPKSIYSITENTNDTITQVAPFAIFKGDLEPVKILYIDETPVFFNQADQLQRYAFKVVPGKHDFRLRTDNFMIVLKDFEVVKGKKTIISILADSTNTLAKVTRQPHQFDAYQAQLLNKYMLKVANNFDGEKTTLVIGNDRLLLNPPPNVYNNKDLLVGPIKENFLNFGSGAINQDFINESGYTYTFTPGLIKQKSYSGSLAFNLDLTSGTNFVNTDFTQYVIKKGEIDSIWTDYLNLRSYTTTLFKNSTINYGVGGRLEFKIDTAFARKIPYVKNIIIYKPDEPSFIQIFPGNMLSARFNLEKGEYRILFLLKDNTYFNAEQINILARGINYYEWQTFKIQPADAFSVNIDASIKAIKTTGYYNVSPINVAILERFNERYFNDKVLKGTMSGRVIDSDKQVIPGAIVKIVGLSQGVSTDAKGYFILNVPISGQVSISSIGFNTKVVKILNGSVGDVILEENSNRLEEVVVVGYGTQAKKSLTGSVASVSALALQGRVAGVSVNSNEMIMIRGTASMPTSEKPLILVDGIPFSGDVSSLAPEDILEINVLKDAEATAIYGARGTHGVIIVKTKKGNVAVNAEGALVSQQQTMRTNFSDEGFWQPKLITDETGTAKFSVKFPDDITNWKTRVIAMNGKKQAGFTETFIKSFKSLSANFVSPLFATDGDEINVIGKLMSYTPFEETVNRKFSYNGTELRNSTIKFKNAHIDTVAIAVSGKDSLKFEYTLKQDNGYFDGEIRKIPVFAQGVLETKGYFSAMLSDTSITYNFDKNLGKITLRAESSVFPTLLDEMTKLRNYEYLCNEQMASKLKGLLLEKQVRKFLDQPFIHEKDILFMIKKLQQNKKPQGTWAWWQNGEEQIWISLHVSEALLKAEKNGYKINFDKQVLYTYLVNKLVDQPNNYEQIQTLKLLHLLDDKYYIKDWIQAFEKKRVEVKPSLFEQLEMMELKQMAGIKINTDSLLKIKKQTMFGSIYWGDQNARFWDNSIQNTLSAYRILKKAGGHASELEKIALYFLEQRKDGQWLNTFESSLILETILPEMIAADKQTGPASLSLNSEIITKFPYDKILESVLEIKLDKKGKMPIYFTAFQQFQNPNPEKVSKDFTVNTSFIQNGNAITKLKAGTLTILKVEVEVRADADYVMIEIPIPAGCSYENKMQNFWGVESHREYFKNKTTIFCTKLKQGKYTFNIDLMPRYSGNYVLNPAKAEMMYFPVFYGREGMKKVGIN